MDLIDQLRAEYDAHQRRDSDSCDAETTIGGESVEIDDSKTSQALEDSYLVSSGSPHGVPRGREAFEAREIGETQPMQLVKNAIVDQLLGGELAYPSDDEDVDQAEADLQALVDDILRGPHLQGEDFDALVAAWVSDMVDLGEGFAEVLGPQSGDLPVAALKPVDPLTIRRDVDSTGTPQDPPYYQAPFRTNAGGIYTGVASSDVTPLEHEELVVLRYPGSNRSDRVYPLSPAMQVKEWLELLSDSTTHHGRYYSDSELPPGLLSVREATDTDIANIREEIQAAKGDPRAAPTVGADARWIEIGGSAVDLDVIQEQQWFIQLVAAAFGLPKTELGLVEDVNRNTAESQLSIVHKRVTKPIAESIGQALSRQLLPQFDLYRQLDQPFDVALKFSDPRQERAHERFIRERYQQNLATYREAREAIGEGEADDDTTVEINGTTVDYGEHPPMVAQALLRDAASDDEVEPMMPEGDGDTDSEEDDT